MKTIKLEIDLAAPPIPSTNAVKNTLVAAPMSGFGIIQGKHSPVFLGCPVMVSCSQWRDAGQRYRLFSASSVL